MKLSPEAEAEIERLIDDRPLAPEYHRESHALALRAAMRWAYADVAADLAECVLVLKEVDAIRDLSDEYWNRELLKRLAAIVAKVEATTAPASPPSPD